MTGVYGIPNFTRHSVIKYENSMIKFHTVLFYNKFLKSIVLYKKVLNLCYNFIVLGVKDMIKEYKTFIKDYLELSQTKRLYLFIMMLTAFLYKAFSLLIPFFASWIIKYATIINWKMTFISLGLLLISYLLYSLFLYFNYVIFGKNMNFYYTKLQTRLLNKLITIDDSFTKRISKGKLLNSINTDVLDIGDMADEISEFTMTILQTIAVLIIVSVYNIYFGIVFLVFSLLYVLIRNKLDRKENIYFNKRKRNADQYSDLFSQVLNGLQEIKTFNMLPKLNDKLDYIKNEYSKNYFKQRKYYVCKANDVRFITHTFSIILYLILTFLISKGKFTVDVLVLIIGYFETNINNLDHFIDTTATIREVNISVRRINEILNYKNMAQIPYGDVDNDYIDGIVKFKDVSFSYKDKKIIDNLSLTLMPNKINTIVGASGTGKTSIINLLLRLYKVDSGHIYIDDIDIYNYNKEIYTSNVAVVNQKPFIFNMSIRKNLDFIDTDINNQIEACKRVGIHDFIVSLPQGYNTILREDATNISGGQKQLISLARTILSKSEILLFDEITSSLDPETANIISNLLEDLKKDHTIIMITHKPQLMKKSDRIIVLNKGKIVGDGKHKDLIVSNEYYQWLQSRKLASKIGVFDND